MAPQPERPAQGAVPTPPTPSPSPELVAPPSAPSSRAGLAGLPGTPSPELALKSRWTPVSWDDLPGWQDDSLHEAWNAWLKNCERPGPVFGPLCADVRRLSIADASEQRLWMVTRLQPYLAYF